MFRACILVFMLLGSLWAAYVPDMKFSLDFTQIEVFKNATLRPLVEQYIQNLTIQGPIDLNLSIFFDLLKVEAQLSNITVNNFSLDWDKTILAPFDDKHVSLTLSGLDITIESDYDISISSLDFAGRANITITNLSAFLNIQFNNLTDADNQPTGSGFTANLTNFTFNYDSLTMDVDSAIITGLINKVFKTFKCLLIKFVSNFVLTNLNPTLQNLTSQIIQIPISPSVLENLALKYINPNLDLPLRSTSDIYIINITFYRAPYVRIWSNTTTTLNYLTLAISVDIFNNNTKGSPTIKENDLLPYRLTFDYDVQAFLCNSLLTQLQWFIIDSGILKLTLDDSMLNNTGSPIRLNTSTIMLILPGMSVAYGTDKGIYLRVSASSIYSQIVFRAGRLVGEVSLQIDFWVDTNSSNYPTEGLEKCKSLQNCQEALSLNATMLLALHADNKDETKIYANIINLDFYNITTLHSQIDFDVNSFTTLMKDVGKSFIPILNADLQGINNTLIGTHGIKDLQFTFSVDYLFLRVVLEDG